MVAKHWSVRLSALVLALCLMIGLAASASAAVLGTLPAGGAAGQAGIAAGKDAQPKYTTRLTPPKTITLKVGEIKRVNYKLKYKIVPDQISYGVDRTDRVFAGHVNTDLFVIGLDTGSAVLTMTSGIVRATTLIKVKPRPWTGIELRTNVLELNQFDAVDMNTNVLPFSEAGKIKWSTDAKSIATLKNGILMAKKPGIAILTAKMRKGGKLVGNVLVEVS